MMESLEISAKTVEEATKRALTQLNVGLEDVEITILREGRGGILGIGAEDARIRVKLVEPPESNEGNGLGAEATDIVASLISKMGIKAEISIQSASPLTQDEVSQDQIVLAVSGEEAGSLIGRRGQTLDALQYIARLMLTKKLETQASLIIDIENYRLRRYEDLRTLAINVGEQVKSKKTSIRLEPMTAYERRIVHMALANDPDIATESIGEGESRKVVVYPKKN
jgi:spoIIIJ-associated protein